VAGGLLEYREDAPFISGQDDRVVRGGHVSFLVDLGCLAAGTAVGLRLPVGAAAVSL
jgi:hypothetical protein